MTWQVRVVRCPLVANSNWAEELEQALYDNVTGMERDKITLHQILANGYTVGLVLLGEPEEIDQ